MNHFLYESHTGGLYFTDNQLNVEQRYCSTCGDIDVLIGAYVDLKHCWEDLKKHCSIDNSGGFALEYVYPILVQEFKLPEKIPYSDWNKQLQGFCSLSEKEILERLSYYTN